MANVRGPKAYLCGEEGDGYWVMQDAINLNLGDQSWLLIGAAEACMETVIDYALKTYRFGHYIWEYQGISFPIAEMAIQTEAARALARQTSSLYDKRDPEVRRLGAIGYRFAGDSALWVATKSMELVGASAIELGEGLPIEQLLRDITLGTMMRTPNMDRMYIAQRYIGKRPTVGRTQRKAA